MELLFLGQIVFLILSHQVQMRLQFPNAGAAFETPRIAKGSSLAPRDARDVSKFPPCFTDRLICVRLIFISVPVPAASDFFILVICLRVSINSADPRR